MGPWVTYGIGSESADLPGFVVLQSGARGAAGETNLVGQWISYPRLTRACHSAAVVSRS